MRIKEILLDKLIDTKLFEMARNRKDAKELVTELSPQIITHLIKLFVFNSPKNKSHWINEINVWLNKIDDIYLKPENKKPNWQTIYNWTIFESSPYYDSAYINGRVKKWLATDYKDARVYDYDAEIVLNQILKIIENVSKDIAIPNKFITIEDYFGVEK